MKIVLTILTASLIGLPMFAHGHGHGHKQGNKQGHPHGHKQGHHDGAWKHVQKVCKKANISETQKSTLRQARVDFRKKMTLLRAQVEVARIDYRQALTLETATIESANAAADILATAKANVFANRRVFMNKVMFEIATPEQRRPLLKCMKLKKKMFKKGHHKKRNKNHDFGGRSDSKLELSIE